MHLRSGHPSPREICCFQKLGQPGHFNARWYHQSVYYATLQREEISMNDETEDIPQEEPPKKPQAKLWTPPEPCRCAAPVKSLSVQGPIGNLIGGFFRRLGGAPSWRR